MSLDSHLKLRRWLATNHGYVHPDIVVAFDTEKGYHARVADAKSIKPDTCVAKCSMVTSLSVLNALHTPPFACRGTRFPTDFLLDQDTVVVQHFFLMEQWLLQNKSWWAPYLRTLPKPDQVAELFFTAEEDVVLLKGTNLEKALADRIQSLRDQFMSGMRHLKKLQWPRAVHDEYTWKLYLWAAAIFSSRSFTSNVLSNTLPADKASPLGKMDPEHGIFSDLFEDGFAVLLPFLDLMNYRPLARVEWQAGLHDVGIQVLDQLQAGQEVCNNYGPRDNQALMLGYGFAISRNPFDYYAVGFRVPDGSPLAEARAFLASEAIKRCKKPRAVDDYQYYVFNVDHPRATAAPWLEASIFSPDLLDSISILSANVRELQSNSFRSRRAILDSETSSLSRKRRQRNLLQTLCQLRLECLTRLRSLQVSDITVEDNITRLPDPKRQNVETYRNGQCVILQTAILACQYCLLKAKSQIGEGSKMLLDVAMAEGLTSQSEPVHNLQVLLGQKEVAVAFRTLFDFFSAVELLPKDVAVRIRTVAEEFACQTYQTYPVSSQYSPSEYDIKEKIKFMALLAALRTIHATRSTPLLRRFKSWMRDLEQWYGFDDETWNGPTAEFLPLLEAFMDVGEKIGSDDGPHGSKIDEAWADPRILCWAWNVQEEEGLFSDIETVHFADGGVHLQPSKYLLCIPLKWKSKRVTDQDMARSVVDEEGSRAIF